MGLLSPAMVTAPFPSAGLADHIDALPPGTRLGEFEVMGLLGVGGFGMVYQAFDHSLLRFVAIKEYMPSALVGRQQGLSLQVRSSSDEQSFQAGLASFIEEARLLAQFDHPSLVKVFRFWEANHTAYMAMPLYAGMTLKQARSQMRAAPPEAWMRKLLWSVASALRLLHQGQTLHRDVSPDNIFLQDSGPPVLLDLGAARRTLRERDGRYTAVLKVHYAPIEQYADATRQLRQGPWSDLYALGAVVHYCLSNDLPPPATQRLIDDGMVPLGRVVQTLQQQFGSRYSPPFVRAVAQCLGLQPGSRPQSVDEFLQALQLTSPPPGLENFDFRAELGDWWVGSPSAQAPALQADAGAQLSTAAAIPATVLLQPLAGLARQSPSDTAANLDLEIDWPVPPAAAPAAAPAAPAAPTAPAPAAPAAPATSPAPATPIAPGYARRRWLPWALALGAMLLLALAWRLGKPERPRYTPESEIINERAPAPPASLPASQPASQPASAPVSAASAAQEPASAAPAAPAFVPAFVPAGTASAVLPAPSTMRPRPAPAPQVRPPPSSAAPITVAPIQAPVPAPIAPAPQAPRVSIATSAPSDGPEAHCASASFLARPLCIHQECQKPALAQHPTCVAARRRQDEEARQRQLYSQ